MSGNISYIVHVVEYLLFMSMFTFLSKILPASNNDANAIKPGSNSKRTDKHATEYSKTKCLGLRGAIQKLVDKCKEINNNHWIRLKIY